MGKMDDILSRQAIPQAEEEKNPESKEKPKRPTYEVSIDREKIAALRGVPAEMKDWLMRLPEQLHFDSVTLIVGENGSGKTSFARAVLDARKQAFQAQYPNSKGMGLMLDPEEPANALQGALKCAENRDVPKFMAVFIEGSEVMSEVRRWAKSETYGNKEDQVAHVSEGAYTHKLSSRQLFDQAIGDLKYMRMTKYRGISKNIDVIFDEPEQGLSPQKQLGLPEYVSSFIEETDTLLVPTNNLALYLSDLPRLDLSQPERGVHRPSEFGEEREIKLYNATSQIK
jgi:predicted ATPase